MYESPKDSILSEMPNFVWMWDLLIHEEGYLKHLIKYLQGSSMQCATIKKGVEKSQGPQSLDAEDCSWQVSIIRRPWIIIFFHFFTFNH